MALTIDDLKYGAEVGDLGVEAVRAVCAEALANRAAQPVAYRYRYNGGHLASFGCGDLVSSWKYCEEVDLISPDERYERQVLFTTPPAVPDEIVNNSQAKALLWELFGDAPVDPAEIAEGVWNACRAAMQGANK